MRVRHAVLSRRELLLAALAASAGCARQGRTPPLAELYRGGGREPVPPLVVIPGAFGSRLARRSTGKEIWPGSSRAILFSNYADIGLDIDAATLEPVAGDVAASGLLLEALGRNFYAALLAAFETAGGYRRAWVTEPGQPADRSFYLYAYDWRLDMLAAVRGLDELIARIAEIHGDSGRQVDILAHSSGGIIARYYARYGTTDVLGPNPPAPGAGGSSRIRRLLLVGTPNLGTIQAVLSHLRGEEVGLRHIPPEVVATCPGATQLMPHPGHNWLADLRGDAVGLDLYDIATWRELRWSIFSAAARSRIERRRGSERAAEAYLETLEAYLAHHLERARQLHAALSGPARRGEPRVLVFGGDCLPTLARVVVEPDRDGYRGYERPSQIPRHGNGVDFDALMHEPGDGVVTRSSLLGQSRSGEPAGAALLDISQSTFVCAPHQTLTAHTSLQDNLLYALLHSGAT